MKKILLSTIVAMSIISCKEKTEKQNETSTEKSEVKIEIKNSTEIETKITFEDFQTEFKGTEKNAKIDFNSNETAKSFKTAISESYKNGKVNFAGNYIITTWGCGTSCISGAMVDVRDGKVYDLPTTENIEGIGNSYDSKNSSLLLITSISGMGMTEDIERIENYWKWNDTNKKFEFIKTSEVKKNI
ncbi:hypothetical protein QMU91_002458 [Flavobacterium psychrophilum]|nr:hypothetical protein [Flavobacterium psychrophilum]